jgi:hypothetical protein
MLGQVSCAQWGRRPGHPDLLPGDFDVAEEADQEAMF